eukprot:375699-Heterocapsa_arctica.AAC.1
MTNERRLGSYLSAKSMLQGSAPVPVTGLVAALTTSGKASTPGTSRPTSPVVAPLRKSRKVDPAPGAGYGTGSAAS